MRRNTGLPNNCDFYANKMSMFKVWITWQQMLKLFKQYKYLVFLACSKLHYIALHWDTDCSWKSVTFWCLVSSTGLIHIQSTNKRLSVNVISRSYLLHYAHTLSNCKSANNRSANYETVIIRSFYPPPSLHMVDAACAQWKIGSFKFSQRCRSDHKKRFSPQNATNK